MAKQKLKRVDLIFSQECSCKDIMAAALQKPKEEIVKELIDSIISGAGEIIRERLHKFTAG